jgi:ubiquinone/menaquinone biosynthesis C-methylase UbiE
MGPMSTTLDFDATAAAQTDAIYSTPDVAATRIAVFRAANPKLGECVLDVGCGPGYLLRELAIAVGEKGRAVGIDISEPMLAIARRRCAGLNNVATQKTDALKIPGADGAFELACALQVYAYVGELDAALAELWRALRPGGRVIILDTDFAGVVWQSENRSRMQKILAAYEQHVAWPDLPRVMPRRLRTAGFQLERSELVPILTLSYHANTYIHGLARFIHRFVTEHAGIGVDEADAWLAEFDDLERAGAFRFAINRFLICRAKTKVDDADVR